MIFFDTWIIFEKLSLNYNCLQDLKNPILHEFSTAWNAGAQHGPESPKAARICEGRRCKARLVSWKPGALNELLLLVGESVNP